jgi:hypothetical protein
MAAIHSTIHRTFAGIQQPFAGMELGVPPAPTSAYKPKDTIASNDSAASGRRGTPYGPHALLGWLLLLWYCFSSPMENFKSSSFAL